MKNLNVRLIKNKKELDKVHKIREIVFIEEQKVPKELEYDEYESSSTHIIAFYDEKAIGAGRIRIKKDNRIKLERIAVLKEYRGKNVGKAIMDFMVNYSKKKIPKEIYLHGQFYAIKFYEKCGFKVRGKPFGEAGIEHIEMYY